MLAVAVCSGEEIGSDGSNGGHERGQGEEGNAVEDDVPWGVAGLEIAAGEVTSRRRFCRAPLTFSMPSRRCLAQRRGLLSEG